MSDDMRISLSLGVALVVAAVVVGVVCTLVPGELGLGWFLCAMLSAAGASTVAFVLTSFVIDARKADGK